MKLKKQRTSDRCTLVSFTSYNRVLHFLLITIFFCPTLASPGARAKTSGLLKAVENHYRSAKFVQMDVSKTLTMKLLQKVKHSEGLIQVKHGGNLRWETLGPDHSLVVINKKAVWMVDYPLDEDQKISVLKASHPRKSQPHAVVAFLLGEGHISDSFKVTKQTEESDKIAKLDLKPTDSDPQFHWLSLFVDKKNKSIEKLEFEDEVGNLTEMSFKNIEFDKKIDDKVFKFTPPKNAEITIID